MSPQASQPTPTAPAPIFSLVTGSTTDWILAILIGLAIGVMFPKKASKVAQDFEDEFEEGEE